MSNKKLFNVTPANFFIDSTKIHCPSDGGKLTHRTKNISQICTFLFQNFSVKDIGK